MKSEASAPLRGAGAQARAHTRGHTHTRAHPHHLPCESPEGFMGFATTDYCQVQKASLCPWASPPPPDLKVIYPPRERWARGRGVGSGKQRLAQRGRCGPETAAPDTQVKLAQTCLRPRGPSKRNPVQAPVKAPALPEPRELSASGPGRAGFLGRQRGTRPGPVGIGAPPGQGARSGCAGESESTEPYSRLNK